MALPSEIWDHRYADHEDWTLTPHPLVTAELECLRPGEPPTALDLGAGAGRHAVWLARRGWAVTAVDFSAVALDQAARLAERAGVELRVVQADLGEHRPAEGAFGLVLISYVHPDPAARAHLLAGAAGALAPGGTLLLVGHHPDNLGLGLGGPSDPAAMYQPERIAAELGGLRIERAGRVPHTVTAADGEREAYATVVVASRPPSGSYA